MHAAAVMKKGKTTGEKGRTEKSAQKGKKGTLSKRNGKVMQKVERIRRQ